MAKLRISLLSQRGSISNIVTGITRGTKFRYSLTIFIWSRRQIISIVIPNPESDSSPAV